MFTILGSGFGLYGYLPALFAAGESRVLLPERYRTIICSRPELNSFESRVIWTPNHESALEAATAVVIAGHPAAQPEAARKCLMLPDIRWFILEKPMAADPAAADALLSTFMKSGRQFRLSYLFLFAPVQDVLRKAVFSNAEAELAITWTFMAHHFAHGLDNWKRHDAQGGGVLRFYGIHLVAALAIFGYRVVDVSTVLGTMPGESERWEARFLGPGLLPCTVIVDCRASSNAFEISATAGGKQDICMAAADPFDGGISVGDQDPRVGFLAMLVRSLAQEGAPFHALYANTNRLWSEVEARSEYRVLRRI